MFIHPAQHSQFVEGEDESRPGETEVQARMCWLYRVGDVKGVAKTTLGEMPVVVRRAALSDAPTTGGDKGTFQEVRASTACCQQLQLHGRGASSATAGAGSSRTQAWSWPCQSADSVVPTAATRISMGVSARRCWSPTTPTWYRRRASCTTFG